MSRESVNCLYALYNTHMIKINALSPRIMTDKKKFERPNVLIPGPILIGTCVTYK